MTCLKIGWCHNRRTTSLILFRFFLLKKDDEKGRWRISGKFAHSSHLENTVLFQSIVTPITVGRDKSIRAVQKGVWGQPLHRRVVAKRIWRLNHRVRVICIILIFVARIPWSCLRCLMALQRPFAGRKAFPAWRGNQWRSILHGPDFHPWNMTRWSIRWNLKHSSVMWDSAKQIIELSPQIPSEAVVMLKNINNDNFLLNFIGLKPGIPVNHKQDILEINNLKDGPGDPSSHGLGPAIGVKRPDRFQSQNGYWKSNAIISWANSWRPFRKS